MVYLIIIIATVFFVVVIARIVEYKADPKNDKNVVSVDTQVPRNQVDSIVIFTDVDYNKFYRATIENIALGKKKDVYIPKQFQVKYLLKEIFSYWAKLEKGFTPDYKEPNEINSSSLVPLFVYEGVDVDNLVSGQEVLLLGDDHIIRVYSREGDLMGFVRKSDDFSISTYPLGLARIRIDDGKYYLYQDPALSYKEPEKSEWFENICIQAEERKQPNYFIGLRINKLINDPDEYLPKNETDNFPRKVETDEWESKTVEVEYCVPWMITQGDDVVEVNLPPSDVKRLLKVEDDGGELTSDYLSKNMKNVHRKILKAIREDMDEKSDDPDDGMVVEYSAPCFYDKVKKYNSHSDMLFDAADDDIEYNVSIY